MDIKPFGHEIRDLKKPSAQKPEQPLGQQVSEMAHAKKAEKAGAVEYSSASAKKQLNETILQTSMEVSISAGNEPMALLYKTAIENINAELEGTLGKNAIQNAYDAGLDVSPEATADRIVSMSTALFESYHAQHTDMSQEEALDSFVALIGSGIDKGFGEARDILSGLDVLEGGIADNIDLTYDKVQSGLKAFVENYGKQSSPEPEQPET